MVVNVLNRSQGYVVLAAFGFSFILVFSTLLKNTGLSSLEQLLLRQGLSLVILLFVLIAKAKLNSIRRNDVPFFAIFGLVYALFAYSGLSSIAFGTPIPVSIALVYTQPIYTAAIAWLTRHEKVTIAKLGVVFIGVLGAFLVAGLSTTNVQFGLGPFFALLTGFFYAVYLWLKRRATSGMLNSYTPYQILFNTFLFAAPSLLVVGLLLRNFSTDQLLVGLTMPDLFQLGLVFLFAAFSTVLPYGLLNYVKAEDVLPTTEGLLLLGDPILHTLWAILFFNQFVNFTQYIGGGLILLSAALNLKIASKAK
jgi:drug/metabolite transporter (DMT)-like permease